MDKLQSQVDQYHAIFSRLYPGKDLETLVSLPREELINLALTLPAPASSPSSHGGSSSDNMPPPPLSDGTTDPRKSDGAESLEALEQVPDQFPEFDEEKRHKVKVQGISDDVNGLSLSVDRQSSYVGVSSINAVLKVIFKVAPIARPFVAMSYNETALPSRANTPPPHLMIRETDSEYTPPPDIGHKLIESYFANVHVQMPMIDEDQFWHTWLYGERKDSPWLALLNMVLALGSLSAGTAHTDDHIVYFKRARKHLDLETFGSGNLLILQALALMSGYYLHWLNRPNEANCLMGATIRMATALGLHREYNEGQSRLSASNPRIKDNSEVPADIRRRTWWSLFCLDTWGSTTTGRPSLGRMGPGITAQIPQVPQQLNNAQYLASLKMLPIIHNIAFCKLATRIQDFLAAQTIPNFDELLALDSELVKWHDDLPPILRPVQADREQCYSQKMSSSWSSHGQPAIRTPSSASSTMKNPFDFSQPPQSDYNCPDFLKTPRAIMHWRYQNLRILMHRPYLLAASLRRSPYNALSAEEKMAVARCRIIAGQSIADIDATCHDGLIAGWAAVWMMFQAAMIPLTSLFARSSASASPSFFGNGRNSASPKGSTSGSDSAANAAPTGCDEDEDKWRVQVETALAFLERMRPWSVAAKKSKDVIDRLYEASRHVSDYQHQFSRQQAMQHPGFLSPGNHLSLDTHSKDPFASPGLSHAALHFSPSQAPILHSHNPAMAPGFWGLSPNGTEQMQGFWEDLNWDTFPSTMMDSPSLGPSFMQPTDFDWNLLGGQGNDPAWQYWPQGPNEHATM